MGHTKLCVRYTMAENGKDTTLSENMYIRSDIITHTLISI